jgi:predicted nuclease of restriction endonuclease-like (RecB) superfamily
MKNKTIIKSQDFTTFLQDIKQKIYSAKSKAILSANRLMIELYFDIGKEIVIKQETLGWGKSVVEKMSQELQNEFGQKCGYSTQNLWYMRQFYLVYKDSPNLQQLVGEIPWGSNILIFSKCKEYDEKEYYIKNSIENGWNRNVLMHHIKTDLYKRDKIENKSNNFELSLPTELSELAQDIVKSEYNLEFLEVSKEAHERVVENKLVENIKKFLNILNDKVKMPHENPSIGIILCTDKDGLEVEYALQNVEQAMGVSTYTYTIKETLPKDMKGLLPTSKEIKERLNNLSNTYKGNK